MNAFEDQHADSGSPNDPHDASHQPLHRNVLTDDILAAIDARLEQLPPRQKLTVESAIKRLAPRIRNLLANGYTNVEVAAELTKELSVFDMTVSTRALARYMPPRKPSKPSRPASKDSSTSTT